MLHIVKASAGSGKTFHLVWQYLRLILTTPASYRNILAVTFTNKATAEMKERILEQLGIIAGGGKSEYLKKLAKDTGSDEAFLRRKAGIVLENLLFDFNRFSVSTIDKFTQRILKAFNREAGLNPNYLLETDNDILLSEAVDRLISKADKTPGLLTWLEDFIADKIENNKSFVVEHDLMSLGNELFREELQCRMTGLTGFYTDKTKCREYLDIIYAIIRHFENRIKKTAAEMVEIYREAGFSNDDFSGKSSGGMGAFLEKTAAGTFQKNLTERLEKAAVAADSWVTKDHRRRDEFLGLIRQELLPRVNVLLEFIRNENRKYQTARIIKSGWYTATLLVDLNVEIETLGKEKGILPMSGSNFLLKGIIDGSDTPFIYEKAGNVWHHFLLDEFQDTSAMQWENLRPLVRNSIADEHFSLVVGDVKQSIYRWRNSDWKILADQINEDFSDFGTQADTLQSNYRSGKTIVGFNNAFFRLFTGEMAAYAKLANAPEYRDELVRLYSDIVQETAPGNSPSGFVSLEMVDAKGTDFEEAALIRLELQIKELYDKGYKAGNMAILVRTNDQGARVVQYFMGISELPENRDYNLRIISGESLFLKSSMAVNFVVTLFRHLSERDNRMYKGCLLHMYKAFLESAIKSRDGNSGLMPEWIPDHDFEARFSEQLEPLIARVTAKSSVSSIDELIIHICDIFGLLKLVVELPYIQALIDMGADLKKSGVNDMTGFIRWWDEKGGDVPVSINEEADAIRVYTFHKAKGLEFKAVLIPFLNWNFTGGRNNGNILWCEPAVSPFNMAPLVPVSFSDKLAETFFSDNYYKELSNILVDNLNMVYVAFTRAAEVLRITMQSVNAENGIGKYIGNAVMQLIEQPEFSHSWNSEKKTLSCGVIPVPGSQPEQKVNDRPVEWFFRDFTGNLRFRRESDNFFEQSEKGEVLKDKGNSLHNILAGIITVSDVEPACRKALASGLLLPAEYGDTREKLSAMVRHPMTGNWFSGHFRIYTETDLLTVSDTYRPDRIMIGKNEAVVVDYKSGAARTEAHSRQVRRYVSLLKESGIPDVKGYIWYIRDNDLVEVK